MTIKISIAYCVNFFIWSVNNFVHVSFSITSGFSTLDNDVLSTVESNTLSYTDVHHAADTKLKIHKLGNPNTNSMNVNNAFLILFIA